MFFLATSSSKISIKEHCTGNQKHQHGLDVEELFRNNLTMYINMFLFYNVYFACQNIAAMLMFIAYKDRTILSIYHVNNALSQIKGLSIMCYYL